MKHTLSLPFRCILTMAICAMAFGFAVIASSESLPMQTDLGMPVMDISADPFYAMPAHTDVGWCVADGMLSDLRVDLDDDGENERLVVYFAPSVEAFEDARDRAFHPPIKDLRLAIFEQTDGEWINQSDIIVEASLITTFANIRLSVWGDAQRLIYIHSSIFRYNSVTTRHAVLCFSGDRLNPELMLLGKSVEGHNLYRIEGLEAAQLYEMDTDMDNHEILLIRRSESSLDQASFKTEQAESNSGASGMTGEPVYDDWGIELTDIREPTDSIEYAGLLSEQLAAYNIDDTKDTNREHCIPICSVRYLYPWRKGGLNFELLDFTGVR